MRLISHAHWEVGGFRLVLRLLRTTKKSKGRFDLRRSLVVALLFAFVLQAQLAASHIHLLGSAAGTSIADSGKRSSPGDQKRLPTDNDCPICQQLASAHSFLAQASAILSLPELIGTQTFEIFDERAPVSLIALNWRSRAPPL